MTNRLKKSLTKTSQRKLDIASVVNKAVRLLDAPRPWLPFRERNIAEMKARPPHGVTRLWENGWFVVMLRPIPLPDGTRIDHVFVRNKPNTPVRSWTDLMRIKRELFNADSLAVEVFPPDAEIIDEANLTHLWILPSGVLPAECSLVRWTVESDEARRAERAS